MKAQDHLPAKTKDQAFSMDSSKAQAVRVNLFVSFNLVCSNMLDSSWLRIKYPFHFDLPKVFPKSRLFSYYTHLLVLVSSFKTKSTIMMDYEKKILDCSW